MAAAATAAEYRTLVGGCGDVFGHIDDLDHIDEFLNFSGNGDDGAFLSHPLDDELRFLDDASSPINDGATVEESKFEPSAAALMETQSDDDREEEEAQIDWLYNFFDDSAAAFSLDFLTTSDAATAAGNLKDDAFFRTSSPVSVLEPALHSSLSSSTVTAPIILTIPGRARSKRPRTPAASISFVPPPEPPPPETESFWDDIEMAAKMTKKTKKKKKNINPLGDDEEEGQLPGVITIPATATTARKCMHCEITKTPQWRAGPLGPRTLCNACGVRYKTGRLFPEYRPAASPTFLADVHSNSHKKVVEMRIKNAPAVKNCDLMEYIRKRRPE